MVHYYLKNPFADLPLVVFLENAGEKKPDWFHGGTAPVNKNKKHKKR